MKLSEFLKQIEFVRDGHDDAHVIISINGRPVDVDYVERDMDFGPFVIVPKRAQQRLAPGE